MAQIFKKVFCEEGCGIETKDPGGICFNCRNYAKKRNQTSGYLGNEELRRRETLEDFYRDRNDGWPYSDRDAGY
jgi:hypothetical protein